MWDAQVATEELFCVLKDILGFVVLGRNAAKIKLYLVNDANFFFVSGILREIDFQLFTSLTRMGSISEYFSSLLVPYSRRLHLNFEFLKNPIF